MAKLRKIRYTRVGYLAHLFFTFAILLIVNTPGSAQGGIENRIPEKLLRAYSALIDFNIQETKNQLDLFSRTKTAHPFQWYIASMEASAQLLSTGDKNDYLQKKHLEDIYLEHARKLSEDDPYRSFLIVEIKMQWALVKLKFGDEITAMWNLRQVYLQSKKALVKFPDFLPLYKTYGFLQTLFSGTPKKYQWVVRLFGINPDMEVAIDLLTKAYRDDNIVAPEAGIITALIYTYYYERYDEAILICQQLLANHSESMLVRLVYAFILIKDSDDANARIVLSGMPEASSGYLQIPAWYYTLGEIDIHDGNYKEAISHYKRFLEMQKGKDLIKDAHYKIAMCYWLSDQPTFAKQEMDIAAVSGETQTEMDIYADYIVSLGKLPNRQLLKARYYTDGGYFQKADSILNAIEPSCFKELSGHVEYCYRRARLYHKTGQIANAISFYKKTIEIQGKEPLYFAPNSCLQLGYILQDNAPEKACIYLRQVLEYKFKIYYHSIQQKAKLALKENRERCL